MSGPHWITCIASQLAVRRQINVTYSYKRLVFFDLVPPTLMGVRSVTEQIKGRIYSPSTASRAVLSASLPCPKPLKKRATLISFSLAKFSITSKIRTADWYPASYEARLAPLNEHFPPDCQAIVFPVSSVKVIMVLLWLDLQWRRYIGISGFVELGNHTLGYPFPVGGLSLDLAVKAPSNQTSFGVSVEAKEWCLVVSGIVDDAGREKTSVTEGFEDSVEKNRR